METFQEYLETLPSPQQQEKLHTLFDWIETTFPELERRVAWNQPMYTHHGTFIIGFSASKKHFSVSPEVAVMRLFEEKIAAAGYSQSSNIFRILWTDEINYELLKNIIAFNLEDKKEYTAFWRK